MVLKQITKFFREDYRDMTRFLVLWLIAVVIFVFIGVNVSPNIANFYTWVAGLALFFIIINKTFFNKRYSIPLVNKKRKGLGGFFSEFIVGGLTYIVFMLFTTGLVWLFQGGITTFKGALVEHMAILSSTTPVLAGANFFILLTYVSIAIMETLMVIGALEFILDLLGIELGEKTLFLRKDKRFVAAWISILSIAVFTLAIYFMTLHFSAKGIENWIALTLVLIMAIFSMVVAVWRKEQRAAIWFHVLATGIAIILTLGLFGIGSVALVALVLSPRADLIFPFFKNKRRK